MNMKKFSYTPGWLDRKSLPRNGHQPRIHIEILKFILPIMGFLIMGTLIIWPKVKSFTEISPIPQIASLLKNNPRLENKVINPMLNSLDKEGRPFVLQAESALQNDPNRTTLTCPKGDIKLVNGTVLKFKGQQGIYQKDSNTLYLSGDVHLLTSEGHHLITRSARFNLTEHLGEGHDPVKGTGPHGESIQAEGFKLNKNSDKLTLTGRVKISIPPQ